MPVYENTPEENMICDGPVHAQFSLSYANYLVWPRSILQEMPIEWQSRLIQLWDEIDEHFGGTLDQVDYKVISHIKGTDIETTDSLSQYRHSYHEPNVPFLKRDSVSENREVDSNS